MNLEETVVRLESELKIHQENVSNPEVDKLYKTISDLNKEKLRLLEMIDISKTEVRTLRREQ